ncbi:MAG: GTP cyclohydrolase II, partial [Streptococcus sp.]|nr:GTP cyclohydrolase II [Streptococcus sp.]
DEPLLLRLHSECLTGDIFGSLRCDCGEQLHAAMEKIDQVGCGAILYLRQEGRGIGLKNKLKAYQLQEEGLDTYEANLELGFAPDERDYQIAADILSFLDIKQVKLLTNNPDKLEQLEMAGIDIVERLPLQMPAHQENKAYLQTKQEKFHHLLHIV